MTASAKQSTRYLGCDVGKQKVVVFDSADGQTSEIENRPQAVAAFASRLDGCCLVVCEATGGYEAALLAAMVAAEVPVHRGDARKIKAFIRSFGTLGKTDAIDARALARYGQERDAMLARWQPPAGERQALQALVLARADLVRQRTAFANRLQAPNAAQVRRFIGPVLRSIERQIANIEAAIAALIAEDADLAAAAGTLRSIGGVGPATAAALLALMPELGHLPNRQAAALAGLAPHPRQSGSREGYRNTRGGRPEVKRALFMAALSASRHDPALRGFYERLVANGKLRLVAITAVMRKIVVIANARLRPCPTPVASG
jgi:transposase